MRLKELIIRYSTIIVAYSFAIYIIIFSILIIDNALSREAEELNENLVKGAWLITGLFIGYNWALMVWKESRRIHTTGSHLKVVKNDEENKD